MADEKPEKSKKKVTDYAGIAALITAVTGVFVLYTRHQGGEKELADVQASTLVVIQYRLEQNDRRLERLEQRVEHLLLRFAMLPKPKGTSKPVSVEPESPPELILSPPSDGARDKASKALPEPPGGLVEKVRKNERIDLQDIQRYVQSEGRPMSLDDLR